MINFNLKKLAELKEENERFRRILGEQGTEIAQLRGKNISLNVVISDLKIEVESGKDYYRTMKKDLEDKLNEVIGKYCDTNLKCLELTDKYNDLLDMSRGKTEE